MKLSLCIASATPALFYSAVELAMKNASGQVQVLGFGNGCELFDFGDEKWQPWRLKCVTENMGVPYALHELWKLAGSQVPGDEHVLAYIHDDVEIFEKGWDLRVLRAFADPQIGLAGFGGSTGLGGDEIYKVPYEIHQLGRRNFYSNMDGAEIHGTRQTTEIPIVSTDGFSMFLRRSLLDKIGGWSWWPFELVHHGYDYAIACQVYRHGYKGMLVPCHVNHIGGQTAIMAVHQDMAKKFGGDTAVHTASHQFVYDNFRDVLPLRIA